MKSVKNHVLHAATALEIFGSDNKEVLDTWGFQYPCLSMSMHRIVARIFGCRWNSVHLLYIGESGKQRKWLAFFTRVNMT